MNGERLVDPRQTHGLLPGVLGGGAKFSVNVSRRCLMQIKHVLGGLIVVVLISGFSSRAMAEFFPWWAFDSVLEEV